MPPPSHVCGLRVTHLLAWQVESMDSRRTSSDKSNSDLDKILQQVRKELEPNYMILCLRNLNPIMMGYPMARPRFYIIGIRQPVQFTKEDAQGAVQRFLEAAQDYTKMTYPAFLHMDPSPHSWERVGQLPNKQELDKLKRCGCTVNPFHVCEVHICKCKGCARSSGADSTVPTEAESGDGTAPEDVLTCSWRRKNLEFSKKHLPHMDLKNQEGRLTYIEVLEMMGLDAPQTARERNTLNLVALLPKAQPLDTSLAVLDLSQALDRCPMQTSGLVPTLATNSKPWSVRHGRLLKVWELMALCGLPKDADMSGQSAHQARHMLGNCMHVADIGAAAAAALFLAMGLLV